MAAGGVATFLHRVPLFAQLPSREIEALAARAIEEAHDARQYVFLEGDASRWFCLVRHGRVRIVRQARAGKEVVLEILGPGEAFGGVAVLERRPYPASAQAMEPSTVVKLPAEAVLALTEHHPGLVRELALLIGRRLRAAHDSVRALATDPVEARLAAALLRLAERDGTHAAGGGLTVPFRLTRQALADMSGTTVESAIRVMSRWTKDGLLRDANGHITIIDHDRLRALAEGEPP